MISLGSKWRHMEGVEREIVTVNKDWVEPYGCGQWLLPNFLAQWTEVEPIPAEPSPPPYDSPELDGTDGAHPAFWRGHAAATDAVAAHLLRALRHNRRLQHPSVAVCGVMNEALGIRAQLERAQLDLELLRRSE